MKKTIILALLAVLCCSSSLWAQNKKMERARERAALEQEINRLIDSKHFAFQAMSMNSNMKVGGTLSKHDRLSIKGDTLTIALPYSGTGRAYDNNAANPLHFTSTQFTYDVETTKKGDKIITINTAVPDSNDRFKMTVRFTTSGMGTLSISSNNYSSLSFSGVIAEVK